MSDPEPEPQRRTTSLEASEKRYRRLFEAARDGILILDADTGKVEDVNPFLLQLLGSSYEGLVGKHLWEIGVFKDIAASKEAFRTLQEKGYVRYENLPLQAEDGRAVAVEFVSNVYLEDRRQVIQCNVRDITARKRAEDELKLRNLLLSTHLDVLTDGVLVVNHEGRIILFNHRFTEILRVPADLLASGEDKPVLEFVMKSMADPDAFLREVECLYAHPEERSHTILHLKDGRVVERYSAPMSGPDGENHGRVWNFRDVTDAKRAEAALSRSEIYYRSLIEHGADIILVLSPDGLIHYVSPAVERLLGRAAQELKGRNVFDLIHPEDQTLARQRLQRALEAGTAPEYVEIRIRHNDGSWRTLAAIGNLLPPEIGPGLVVNARDRTEHQHLETQMRQAQKMEAVGRLAGGIAHDFNNLLTAILGYADLLAERVAASPDLAEDVAEIQKAGQRAATLTRQLLTFSRNRPTEQRVLSLDSVVADTDRMLRRLVGEDVHVTAKGGSAGLVKVDLGQIEQVLVNLAVNARDAMPDGGQLTIETSRAELDETYAATHLGVKPGRYVLLAVTDTGTGMKAATLGHLFEPFFTTKEQGKGTGLGLSTVYGIVKQSGGHIEVYSEPGLGTTFKIYLPAVEEEEKRDLPPSSAIRKRNPASETILLVEDEESLRVLVRRTLESRGYSVLTPASTDEALLVSERNAVSIHLLLTDIVMPGMLGTEVARRARAFRPDLKVLYMSGYTDESIMQRGILQGDEAFIQKPFTPDALSQKVREVLDGPAGAGRQG